MWTPAQGRLGGKNMVVLVPLSGCILGMILLFFFPFIITEFIQQLFFALLPIIGLVIAIISNIFLFISLKKSKSMILKIFCLLILLSEMLFLSYKVYNDIYINHIIKVTLEIKNESPTENIFKVQRRNFNMNKAELVSAIADKATLSKKDAEAALKAFTDVVAEELKKGEKIQLVGFGTFEVSERAARTGRNPQTGKEMTIPASKAPKFKAGKALKDMINA